MRKVLIVGAGGQGGPCASILARDKGVTEIVLGDIDIELANKVKNKIKSDKIAAMKLDAGKIEDIEVAAKGVDVIINLTLPRFDINVMKAAVKSGAHYVDTARSKDDPVWRWLIEGRPLELDDEFKQAGLTALIACGGTPGVTNVLARYVCDKLDRVDEILVVAGGRSLEEPKGVASAWSPGWCVDEALENYEDEVDVFENGKYKRYPAFYHPGEYKFPEPIGTVLVTGHTHEEAVTLPRFIGKGIKNCAFRYPYDPIAGVFVQLGLTSGEPIDVRNVKVVPREVLIKLIKAPVNRFLEEDESTVKGPPVSASFIIMEIKGAKAGEDVAYKLIKPSATPEENLRLYKQFGTARIGVALPAIVGVKMCVAGEAERGVIAPECLDAKKFLKMMADAGAPVRFEEIRSKEVSVC
jgi:saccharopine dehydrogenase-like NADP-dependent oxidoreductase